MQQTEVQHHNGPRGLDLKGWLITLLILAVPVVNIVMLFIWAFGADTGRKYYAQASLIIGGIFLVLYIILMVIIFALSGAAGTY